MVISLDSPAEQVHLLPRLPTENKIKWTKFVFWRSRPGGLWVLSLWHTRTTINASTYPRTTYRHAPAVYAWLLRITGRLSRWPPREHRKVVRKRTEKRAKNECIKKILKEKERKYKHIHVRLSVLLLCCLLWYYSSRFIHGMNNGRDFPLFAPARVFLCLHVIISIVCWVVVCICFVVYSGVWAPAVLCVLHITLYSSCTIRTR